jgi:hypothetical protein
MDNIDREFVRIQIREHLLDAFRYLGIEGTEEVIKHLPDRCLREAFQTEYYSIVDTYRQGGKR